MLFESGNVLVQVEQARHRNLDLVGSEVGERRPQKRGHKVLHVEDVVRLPRVEAGRDLVRLDQGKHVREDGGVHREAGRVRRVRHDTEHVLQDVRVVGLVERLRGLGSRGRDVLQQLEQDIQSRIGDVAHRVLEGPDDGIEDELKLHGRDREEGVEAVEVDGLQQDEEVGPVLGELFEVLVDHVQGALEYSLEDFGDLRRDRPLELVDGRRHGGEDLGLPGRRDRAPLVVEEDGVEERRDEVFQHHVGVVRPLDPAGDELQGLLLDDAH